MSRSWNCSNVPSYDVISIKEKESFVVRFLYHTFIGRCVLWVLIRPFFSCMVGWFLNRKLSCLLISPFVRKNKIDLSRFESKKYLSFNDFFSRKLATYDKKYGKDDFIAPCDGKLSFYSISDDFTFQVKGATYSLKKFLQDDEISKYYREGACLIFRLTPKDYHRYHFLDEGSILKQKHISGVLHTVRPIALERVPVFHENAREVTVLNTSHFGLITQVEVGALMVGKIVNHPLSFFQRGEEKGTFLFGGSTIVVLVEADRVDFFPIFSKNTQNGLETIVHYGDVLGKTKKISEFFV